MQHYWGMTVAELRAERVRRGLDKGGDRTKAQLVAVFERLDKEAEEHRLRAAGPQVRVPFRSVFSERQTDRFKALQRQYGVKAEQNFTVDRFVIYAPPAELVATLHAEFEGVEDTLPQAVSA